MTTYSRTSHPTAAQPPPAPTPARRFAQLVAGRRSKWIVLVLWVLLISVGGSLASKIGSVENNDAQTWLPANAQSTQAVKLAEQHFADQDISTAVLVYARSGGLTAADLAKVDSDRTALTSRHIAVAAVPAAIVSTDHDAAFLTVPLRTSKSDNSVIGNGVDQVRSLATAGAPGGLTVKITGQAGALADFINVYSGMDGALLGVTLAVVALLLLLTYRSPVLWLVPLMAVGLASEVATGVVYLLAKHAGLTVNGESSYVLTVLALGIGTDYALLLIARYREELRRHTDRHQAMAAALQRSLPAIGASAATVGLATLCLVFGRMNSTRGLGPVVAIGVVVVFAAMSTLLPALLVILGRWVFWPFVPRYSDQAAAQAPKPGLWDRVSAAVGRRPRPIWIGAAAVLAALAFGALGLTTGQTQAQQFTKPVESVAGQQLLAQHFPAGDSEPADVYVPAGGADAALAAVASVPGVSQSQVAATSQGWTHITTVLRAAPDTAAARATVEQIRTALARSPGAARQAVVGGQTAVTLDTSNAEHSEEELLIPVILLVVLVMLALLLRSLVAPLVLLVSVVLSFAAAVGTATLLFHALGHPRVDPGLLLFGFLFLVALGVDYTIFLMTRVREEVQLRGHREGVLAGLAVTGGVITSAGVVLAATFSVLAVIPTVNSLQQGLLVAVGVLLDTFIVRSLLIPALALEIGPRIWLPGTPQDAAPPAASRPRTTPVLSD